MATDWTNVAGLGLLFMFPETMVPVSVEQSCLHPEREGNAFCPTCGRKVDTYQRRDLGPIAEALQALREALPRKYEMHELNSQRGDGEVFIGYAMLTTREDGPCAETRPMPDVAEVERTVMVLLEPYAVKFTKPFGLFLCQCIS